MAKSDLLRFEGSLDLNSRYRLSSEVVLRPDSRVGGIVYHRGSDRLFLLSSTRMLDLLRSLDGSKSLRDLLADFPGPLSLKEATRQTLLKTLDRLNNEGLIDAV
jgi:putative mycofactocin binding protein MftB